ncbi:outer membrane beta-barrel protein [Vibrio rotiferianus]|uniref:Outer membrane beta-barrel protein n=1 Tax=Vibrio rotiferianus TaxID=190895 RepID=A0A7Y3ZBZ2_9VIBR|nr:outer membrane beta-barrel protein [Vibrio rotiferianus]NOH50108.1 outer membrane beta-barrel protein [Vibrio rotiferianus]
MINRSLIALTLLAAFSSANANANANAYIGASVGKAGFDDASTTGHTSGYSASAQLELEDDESLSGKLYGGYQFNEYLSLEGSIGGFDALDGSIVTVGDMKYAAIQPRLSLPLGDRMNLFAKAGISYFNAEFNVSNALFGGTGYTTFSDSTVTGIYGLGAEFAIASNFMLLMEWEYMKPELEIAKVGNDKATIEAEISTFSVGMRYKF